MAVIELVPKSSNASVDVRFVSKHFHDSRSRRFRSVRDDGAKRRKWTDKLAHSPGLLEEYCDWLGRDEDVASKLLKLGAKYCVVISSDVVMDGVRASLQEGLRITWERGFGSLLVFNELLGYYYAELGERHAIIHVPKRTNP